MAKFHLIGNNFTADGSLKFCAAAAGTFKNKVPADIGRETDINAGAERGVWITEGPHKREPVANCMTLLLRGDCMGIELARWLYTRVRGWLCLCYVCLCVPLGIEGIRCDA
jgi:hypothetical protein